MYSVYQDARGCFYISSFNGRGTHFQVLWYIIYAENKTFSVKWGLFWQFGPYKDQVFNWAPFCKHWKQSFEWHLGISHLTFFNYGAFHGCTVLLLDHYLASAGAPFAFFLHTLSCSNHQLWTPFNLDAIWCFSWVHCIVLFSDSSTALLQQQPPLASFLHADTFQSRSGRLAPRVSPTSHHTPQLVPHRNTPHHTLPH